MAGALEIILDGRVVPARAGERILDTADRAGVWIPRLCHHPELTAYAGCRLCLVKANGRVVTACTQPVTAGMVVVTGDEEVAAHRLRILELLFVEGNHFCMYCERSGSCELQALGYRLGLTAPRYPFLYPRRELDATHPGVFLDHHRCVLCGRCVRASRERDGREAFGFVGRGADRRVAAGADEPLAKSDVDPGDRAMHVCPVGALLVKGRAFRTPIGERTYDRAPIGSDVESRRKS